MSSEFLWYIVAPDGRFPWEPEGTRATDFEHLKQIASAVDRLGYTGALLATGLHDVWVLGSALAPFTERMRFLLAVHPGLISPTLLAKMAFSFDDLHGGRLLFNVVNGDTRTFRQQGLFVEHDDRYALSAEYWTVVKRLLQGETFDFHGEHIHVEGAGSGLGFRPIQQPHPPLWFGGSSEAGLQMAASHIDRYLSWGEPPAQLAEKIARLRSLAEQRGREIKFGLRVHLIARDTDAEAWKEADHLLKSTSQRTLDRMDAISRGADSVGQQRQYEHHQGRLPDRAQDLEISPNLWPGMSLLRPGPGTALVGSHGHIVERLQEYEALGIDTFIVSGYPLLEEAYHVAETILPAMNARPPAPVVDRRIQPNLSDTVPDAGPASAPTTAAIA